MFLNEAFRRVGRGALLFGSSADLDLAHQHLSDAIFRSGPRGSLEGSGPRPPGSPLFLLPLPVTFIYGAAIVYLKSGGKCCHAFRALSFSAGHLRDPRDTFVHLLPTMTLLLPSDARALFLNLMQCFCSAILFVYLHIIHTSVYMCVCVCI